MSVVGWGVQTPYHKRPIGRGQRICRTAAVLCKRPYFVLSTACYLDEKVHFVPLAEKRF